MNRFVAERTIMLEKCEIRIREKACDVRIEFTEAAARVQLRLMLNNNSERRADFSFDPAALPPASECTIALKPTLEGFHAIYASVNVVFVGEEEVPASSPSGKHLPLDTWITLPI
jgi:hypothetical protein